MLLHDFWSKYHQNEFLFEDGTIISIVCRKACSVKITIDFHLTFYSPLKQLCKKVANALNALTRIASYRTHNPK